MEIVFFNEPFHFSSAFEAEVTDVKQADKDSAYEYTINIKTEYKVRW